MPKPRNILMSISNQTGKAAEVYPAFIRLLDQAGVPPSERTIITRYLLFALDAGDDGKDTGGMIQ